MDRDNIYQGQERRRNSMISEELIEIIAERAAEKAADKAADKAIEKMENKIYQSIGKTFITRIFQFVGAVIVGLGVYLNSKGYLNLEGK
jgi:hypothetical protein